MLAGGNGCTATSLYPILAAETYEGMFYPFFATNVGSYTNGLPAAITLPTIKPTANTANGTKSMLAIFMY